MMTPHEFAKAFILRWEDGGSTDPAKTHSLDKIDSGNWVGDRLIGSNHGVTAPALAAHRRVPVSSITQTVMRALTLDEAADIALGLYYKGPKLDLLAWNRVSASVFDMGWGTGPKQAIKLLQRMLDVADDGVMGPATAGAFNKLCAAQGEAFVSGAWWAIRDAFYEQIIGVRPANAKYEKGWDNRSRYFTPGDAEGWWGRFAA